jgi:serine phosphatase RsbU (regulator of sigma subunit)
MAASFLNGIVIENKVHAPEEILYELNKKVRAALQHEGTSESAPLVSDTIEIAVCRVNKQKTEMSFSSAGMPVIIVRKNQVIEYRGAEQRAGSVSATANPFIRNTIELQKSDKLFLFSDGLTSLPGSDQRHVYDLLATLQSQAEIDKYIREHSGNLEQPDDVLLLGAEIQHE